MQARWRIVTFALAFASAAAASGAERGSGSEPPQGFEMRADLADQFLLALPSGWTVYRQPDAAAGTPHPRFGMVIFTADPMVAAPGLLTPAPATLAAIDRGDTAAFFVDRRPATPGMNCDAFSRRATYELGTSLAADVNRGARRLLGALEPRHRKLALGGCAGLGYRFESGGWIADIRAVSDGEVLYLFTLRNREERFAGNLAVFDAALASLRLAAAGAVRSAD